MRTVWKTTALVALVAIVMAVADDRMHASRATPPIGYVSWQRIRNESVEAKADGARLLAAQQQKTKDLKARQQALETTQQLLKNPAWVLRFKALRAQQLQQQADLERATAQAQSDLQTLQRELQQSFGKRVKSVLDELMARENVQLVLNEDTAVIWSAPGADLTKAVIERLNASAPKVAAAPPKVPTR